MEPNAARVASLGSMTHAVIPKETIMATAARIPVAHAQVLPGVRPKIAARSTLGRGRCATVTRVGPLLREPPRSMGPVSPVVPRSRTLTILGRKEKGWLLG